MAYAPLRSMNENLWEGATDGKYKKIVMDRECTQDIDGRLGTTYRGRDEMDDVYHGFHEKQVKDVPGGIGHRATPNYYPNPPADRNKW